MKTVEQKLIEVEASMRRWSTRLTRAANALRKLDAKRRRLLNSKPGARLTPAPMSMPELRAPDAPNSVSDTPAPVCIETDHISEEGLPEFLRITADAEALRAERRKREAAERHKMPLTGRAALEAVRPQTAKRRKVAVKA